MLPGKRVAIEERHQPAADLHAVLAVLGVEAAQEVVDQPRDLLAALAQRRDLDAHHVEAEEEVLAEALACDHLLQRTVGGASPPARPR